MADPLLRIIRTPRLLLRPIQSNADGNPEFEWYHLVWISEGATKWSAHPASNTKDDSRAWAAGILWQTCPASQPRISYVVCLPKTEEVLSDDSASWDAAGVITLLGTKAVMSTDGQAVRSDSYEAVELGYLFLPETWGKGIATESLTAMLDAYRAAAMDLKLPKDVRADVHASNKGSLRVVEKLGFRKVCHFMQVAELPVLSDQKEHTIIHLQSLG